MGVAEGVLAFVEAAGSKYISMTDRIIGCPHEEGMDYEGPICPSARSGQGASVWPAMPPCCDVGLRRFRGVLRPSNK
jgi:hypothetical protein